jgi:hypothetical protein
MYCIYKEVLGFAGYILSLKSLVSGSSPIFTMAEILDPTWYSRPGYLLIPVHNKIKLNHKKKNLNLNLNKSLVSYVWIAQESNKREI